MQRTKQKGEPVHRMPEKGIPNTAPPLEAKEDGRCPESKMLKQRKITVAVQAEEQERFAGYYSIR